MQFLYKILLSIFITSVLAGCGGYNKSMQQYSQLLQGGKYGQAYSKLDDMDALQHQRNRFLYLAEKGRLARLMGNLDSSNAYLNAADNLLEDTYKRVGETVASNLVNPLMETYLAVDYERFMLHYYKALNYLQLQDKEAAVVEARRITLQAQRLLDKKMLAADGPGPFAYTLQGIIYEQAGMVNDAFISYRNAVDLSLGASTAQPTTKLAGLGLLATALQSGFNDDYNRYSKLLNYTLPKQTDNGGSLLVLHDAGWAPQKENSVFSFNSWLPGNTDMLFTDRYNRYSYPVAAGAFSSQSNIQPAWFMGLRVAMAIPRPVSSSNWVGSASEAQGTLAFEKMQDLNTMAARPSIMKQELIKSIIRALAKKAVEFGAQESARAIAKSGDDKNKDDKSKTEQQKQQEKKKQDDNAAAIAQGVGLLVNLVNQATERADTRTWSTLPAAVYGVRIPLQKGSNHITLTTGGITKTIDIDGGKGLQVIYW
jgi:hypothetical protein